MKREIAEFKAKKQSPAKELDERKGGKAKKSSKKPWRFDNSWKPDVKFTRVFYPNGISGERIEIIKTYKQIQEEKANQSKLQTRYDIWGFAGENIKPQPSGNYKTKKDALQAWENFKAKSNGFGSFVYTPTMVNYKLINIETGEKIEL